MCLLRLIGFVLVFLLTGPLWVVGFVLSWLHWLVNKVAAFVLGVLFWRPCRWAWSGMLGAWRAWRAAAQPADEIAAAGERMRRRASRAMRGR